MRKRQSEAQKLGCNGMPAGFANDDEDHSGLDVNPDDARSSWTLAATWSNQTVSMAHYVHCHTVILHFAHARFMAGQGW